MLEISTITIGLALLGFVLGAVIVALASQSRARRLNEAHDARVRKLREEERRQQAYVELAERAHSETKLKLREAKRAIEAGVREAEILRAQFAEEQEAAYGLEDRLNATEARALSMEAELAQQRSQLAQRIAELDRRATAHDQLKLAHKRLAEAHFQSRSQRDQLVHDLERRASELDSLQLHLDALQTSVAALVRAPGQWAGAPADEATGTMRVITSAGPTGTAATGAIVPAQLQQVALAKAEVQALLRQREQEIAELRSQLSSMRYSLNVLTSAGAALAAQISDDKSSPRTAEPLPLLAAPRQASIASNQAAMTEQLASLEGIIADWFGDLESPLPYSAALLRAFTGVHAAGRYGTAPTEIVSRAGLPGEAQIEALMRLADDEEAVLDDSELDQLLADTPALPADVMLAAIKAATVTAIRRGEARQNELQSALSEAQAQLEQMRLAMATESALVLDAAAEAANGDDNAAADPETVAMASAERVLPDDESASALIDPAVQEGEPSEGPPGSAAPLHVGEARHADDAAPVLVSLRMPVTDPAADEAAEAPLAPVGVILGAPEAAASTVSAAASRPFAPVVPAGIPRPDVPAPSVPKPAVPTPLPPGPAAAQADPDLRTAWGKFRRRVETVLNRTPKRH